MSCVRVGEPRYKRSWPELGLDKPLVSVSVRGALSLPSSPDESLDEESSGSGTDQHDIVVSIVDREPQRRLNTEQTEVRDNNDPRSHDLIGHFDPMIRDAIGQEGWAPT